MNILNNNLKKMNNWNMHMLNKILTKIMKKRKNRDHEWINLLKTIKIILLLILKNKTLNCRNFKSIIEFKKILKMLQICKYLKNEIKKNQKYFIDLINFHLK